MDLVPENIDGAVVFNVVKSCASNRNLCGNCVDFAVGVHNCLVGTQVRYVVVDLQDEKEICGSFLEELLQLAKRMRMPFVFAGVMDRAKRMLESYDFPRRAPLFVAAEDAVAWLEKTYPGITKVSTEGVEFGVPVATSRPRNGLLVEAEGVEAEGVD